MADEPSDDKAEESGDRPLKAARIESADERPAYAPRIPWKAILAAIVVVLVFITGYQWREAQKEEALRTQITQVYRSRIVPVAERYRSFREKLERLVLTAVRRPGPEEMVDPRLRISALHRGEGLYLRVQASDVHNVESLELAARSMGPDSIGACLGVAPTSARGLYDLGGILRPEWVDKARDATSLMKLRVLDTELARRSEREVPAVVEMMRAEYFLLVVDRGATRSEGPADVYMWDLRSERPLLATRTQLRGTVVPIRIAMPGAPRTRLFAPDAVQSSANDCSIAAQVKARAGEPVVEFASEVPSPAAPDAGTDGGDAAADGDAEEADAGAPDASE